MENDKQIIRDKVIRSQRSKVREKNDSNNLKFVEKIIEDLENGGPAGLLHVAALSDVIKSPIRIWTRNNEIVTSFGDKRNDNAVDIEYHEPNPHVSPENNYCGHWSLRGDKEPLAGKLDESKNDCLFNTVAAQVGKRPGELRRATAKKLKKCVDFLVENVEEIRGLDERAMMIGGARYRGRRARDAKIVIDNSQNQRCYGYGNRGHPRGHASHPGASGATDSVENYSQHGMKTGFLSRSDQDFVGHLALSDDVTQMAMNELNKGRTNEVIRLPRKHLGNSKLPKAREWYGGRPVTKEQEFRDVLLVLRHHEADYENPDADVFIQTFYPRL